MPLSSALSPAEQGEPMDAGYGAEEQASRKARRLEQLRREHEAHGAVDAAVEAQIARAQQDVRRWAQGAEGERMVADTLAMLGRYGWTALHDVHWPGRQKANIDHIAVGPGGVVVIDAKNWTGDVAVRDGELRQNGYRRTDAVEGAAEASGAVAALLRPEHRAAVAAVLCLATHDQEPVRLEPGAVVIGRHQLASTLVGLPQRLVPADVAAIEAHLRATLGGQRSPALMTTAALDRPPRQRTPTRRAPGTDRRPSSRARASRPAAGPGRVLMDGLGRLLIMAIGAIVAIPLFLALLGQLTQSLTGAPTP